MFMYGQNYRGRGDQVRIAQGTTSYRDQIPGPEYSGLNDNLLILRMTKVCFVLSNDQFTKQAQSMTLEIHYTQELSAFNTIFVI